MTEEKRWIKNPDFRLEELDGEAILYNSAAAKVMSLNQTSFLIWEMCNGDCTTETIIKALCDVYPESAAAIPADVEQAISLLSEHQAIK